MDEVNLAAIAITSILTGAISGIGSAFISVVVLKERVNNLKEADLRHENNLLRMESQMLRDITRVEVISTRAHNRIDNIVHKNDVQE